MVSSVNPKIKRKMIIVAKLRVRAPYKPLHLDALNCSNGAPGGESPAEILLSTSLQLLRPLSKVKSLIYLK